MGSLYQSLDTIVDMDLQLFNNQIPPYIVSYLFGTLA